MNLTKDWYAPYVYGAISAVIVVAIIIVASTAIQNGIENDKIHTARLVVEDRLCFDKVLGSNVSKIKDVGGEQYFVENGLCKQLSIGGVYKITYKNTHQLFSSDDYDFKTITGYIRMQ